MKHFLRKLVPEALLKTIRPYYHGAISLIAHHYFGKPSERLIVIGVTGTNGKTTTVNLIAAILKEANLKSGFSSTANYDNGNGIAPNKVKITTPSGWVLQKRMAEMVRNNCKTAIIEISSEGLAQNRHLGIHFDIAVFTNLTPEHIESHGGFENYKRAKGLLFEYLTQFPTSAEKLKIIPGLQKTIIVNSDSEHANFYKKFPAEKYLSFSVKNTDGHLQAKDIHYRPEGISFIVKDIHFDLQLRLLDQLHM
jgi:UDP-N-acetylmuramoyl-L-alanyl-D-glutamate--2,6-diaminopimelate ligase